MAGKDLVFKNIGNRLELFRAFSRVDLPEPRFTAVETLGLAPPMHACRAAINYAFLEWHRSQDRNASHDVLRAIALSAAKVIDVHPFAPGRALRECFDSFWLQCAILSDDVALAESVAEKVFIADESSRYQFHESWTGILAGRVLGDDDRVRDQAAKFAKYKPDRTFAWPSPAIVDAFVRRDYASLKKAVRTGAEKHWRIAEREGALAVLPTGETEIDVAKKHEHFFWPYVEAVFAKLAIRDGANMRYESKWLPRPLIAD
ncbi:MAG TPA: hypothetical protein VGN72_15375 [Tepidisphaeraceae bacterium]|jgi:hypothetical protein|nr:hypothetical protein [Tepidisphaeraceae bacterium]